LLDLDGAKGERVGGASKASAVNLRAVRAASVDDCGVEVRMGRSSFHLEI
jgi:hypothetical protein